MNKDQERSWKIAEKASSAERRILLEETRAQVVALLKKSREDISLLLAGQPTEYQQWRLPELNREIDRMLTTFGDQAGQRLSTAAGAAWTGGVAAIDKPLVAVGLSNTLPHLDDRQLMGMRAFMVERIKDVGAGAASKIKQELGLAMIGSQSVHETITKVADLIDGGKARATTIVRTELSRAWAVASYERAQQTDTEGTPMDKIWRRSGKLYPRQAHLLADGRRVPIDQPFMINGNAIRFPHDPKAPAAETINCGCICLYRPREIKETLPDHRPFTEHELAMNPDMAQLANGPSVRQLLDQGLREVFSARATEIANAPIEHMSAYSIDGGLLFNKSGDVSSIRLSAGERGQLNDAVLLHNHPEGPLSFSPVDVKLAVWHDLAETHVVDRLFHYEIVRPESANWGPAYWSRTLRPIVDQVMADVKSSLDAALKDGLIADDQYDGLFYHLIWDRVTDEADIGYRRLPRVKK